MKTTEKQYNNFNQTYSSTRDIHDYICDQDFYQMLKINLTGKKVLDIGCGNGNDIKKINNLGGTAVGVEPSINFIKEGLDQGLEIIEGVGESLPFEDDSFDLVISKYAIQTSSQAKKCLDEAARVLEPKGTLHILVKHPIRQFLEKKKYSKGPANYFKQEITTSIIYDGLITLQEPSHGMEDYLNADFFRNFELIDYRENFDFPASEQIDGDIYPTYFVLSARKK